MKARSKTIENLIKLGFRAADSQVPIESVKWNFESWDLTATYGTNQSFIEQVLLLGHFVTTREAAFFEHGIPHDLDTKEEVAAWLSYFLQSHTKHVTPKPLWLQEGERNWDLIPFIREQTQHQKEYENRLRCEIERDQAGLLKRKLQSARSRLKGPTGMSIQFSKRILKFDINGEVIEILADGSDWPVRIKVDVTAKTKFPKRFSGQKIELSIYESRFHFGHYSYEAVVPDVR